MPASPHAVLSQLDDVLTRCDVRDGTVQDFEYYSGRYSDSWRAERVTACIAAIERFTEPGSAYRRAAEEPFSNRWMSSNASTLVHVAGIVVALRKDVAAGYLQNYAELLHADLFADLLEMARELQNKGFKDAAAVITGSVLEEHLRKLADKHEVPIEKDGGAPKKASALNADLANNAYTKLDQSNVTAWLSLRNSAAHGQYDHYDHAQVAALIQGVQDFIVRHPA
jgi:hypothetical protein